MALNRDERKSVALVMPSFQGGGVERIVVRTALELIKQGFNVEIVVASDRGPFRKSVPDHVSVVNLNVPLGSGRLILAVWPLARYLRNRHPSVLWSSMTEMNIVSLVAKLVAGVDGWLIVSEHNTLSVRVNNRLRRRILALLARLLYPRADRIHAVSKGVANDLASVTGLDRTQVKVIGNPVVTPEILREAAEPLTHPWFATSDVPVVLAVGRLVPAKDFGSLIMAFSEVVRQCRARLVILGEGPERRRLEGLVRSLKLEQVVEMPGFVLNPYRYMTRATVFVLSSRWEGLPTVLIEAMALGIPVVATDCPSGPAEILEGGRWGKLVPVGSVTMLASGILQVLRERAPERIEGARERASQFGVQAVVERYVQVLFPIVG